MERLNSWLSPDVMHALGWALIHSLWQCLAIAALAAVLLAFSRRPSVRYVVTVGALALMLAAPVATFFMLMKPAAPVQAFLPTASNTFVSVAAAPVIVKVPPLAATPMTVGNKPANVLEDAPNRYLPPNILPWLVGAWLCGVALFSLRLAGGFLLLERKRHRQSSIPGPRILAMCHELQHQLGLNGAIRYLECNWLQAPAVIGWIRPLILLPVAALTGLTEEQLRAVIAHELAHIRRLDSFVNLLQILVETLLFYHPAIWWLNRRIRAERELCCDEIAVSLTGNRLEYAHALTLMAEWEKAPTLAMAANCGSLTERIFHILGHKRFGAGQRMLGLTGSILFLATALGAANALFGIAYPIPAQAKVNIKTVLVSSQETVDRIARQVSEASGPDEEDRGGKIHPKIPHSSQTRATIDNQTEKLVVPPTDLSQLVHTPTLVIPTVVASNPAPAASIEGESTMRKTLMAASSLALLAGASQVGAQSNDAPTGAHDPDALTCNAPQLVPLAKAVGWRICVQNSLVATLGEDGGVSLGGTAVKSFSDLSISEQPTGAGDPNAVTCQEAQLGTGGRSRGPIACAHNDFWAKLNTGGCVLTPNARVIIRSGTSKNLDPLYCKHIMGRNGILPPIFF